MNSTNDNHRQSGNKHGPMESLSPVIAQHIRGQIANAQQPAIQMQPGNAHDVSEDAKKANDKDGEKDVHTKVVKPLRCRRPNRCSDNAGGQQNADGGGQQNQE